MRPLGRLLLGFGFGFCLWEGRSRYRRGGKVGISRLLRDFQGSVGAGENLLLVFPGFHAPVFSTALANGRGAEWAAIRIIVPDDVRSEPDRHRFVKMLVDRYRLLGQAVPPPALFDLPPAIPNLYRIVLAHHSVRLHREYKCQVPPMAPSKRCALLLRGHRKLLVKLADVSLPEKLIRRLQCGDPCQP